MIADPAAWGHGVGREAERLTLAKAFDELDAHRVYGRIPATNQAAKKVVTWLGWKHEGTMRDHIRRPDGTLIDCEVWGVTATDWAERWRDGVGRAELLADGGAAARSDEFFRCGPYLGAERATHTLRVEADAAVLVAPLIVREIPGGGGLDAVSPYGYPGVVVAEGELREPLAR